MGKHVEFGISRFRKIYIASSCSMAYLVNYGWRYRRGMPISSSIAESAVNEVVSLRCAKKAADALDQ